MLTDDAADAYYVRPAIVEMPSQCGPVIEETFAPILYVMRYSEFDAVLDLHNGVPQGLSSSIFTNDMREAETFISARGSDCGIANVNIGHPAPKSAGPSAAKRKPAAAANPARTAGRPICAAPPTR